MDSSHFSGVTLFATLDYRTFVPLAICIILACLGYRQINNRLRKISEKRQRIDSFLKDLKSFVESRGVDRQAFMRMVYQSALVQRDIGLYGIAMYKPPGSSYFFKDYQLIVNHLQELNRLLPMDDAFSSLKPGMAIAESILEGLIRYLGVIDDIEPRLKKMKRNYLVLLREGVGWLLATPITFFSFVGIVDDDIPDVFTQNRVVKFISGVFALVGFMGSIVTLVTGWSKFIEIVAERF